MNAYLTVPVPAGKCSQWEQAHDEQQPQQQQELRMLLRSRRHHDELAIAIASRGRCTRRAGAGRRRGSLSSH